MNTEVTIRSVSAADASPLAVLRWEWAHPGQTPAPAELREFALHLERWLIRRREEVVGMVAVADGHLVGMAWLAVFDRVPNPGNWNRRTGDVQSVFVLPTHRGTGLGMRLVQALCDEADRIGIARVTVQSENGTEAFYERLGFTAAPSVLLRELGKGT